MVHGMECLSGLSLCFLLLLLPTTSISGASGCSERADCSHNGKCVAGVCECSPGWTAADCHQLKFVSSRSRNNSTRLLGLNAYDATHPPFRNTSSWGGAVVRGDDGLYHMFAAVMAKHCGLGTYKSNSYIGHAVSPDPITHPFALTDTSIASYAHEPDAIRDPTTGEYVLFFTASYRPTGWNWSIPVWGDEAAANPGRPVDCALPAAEQRGFACAADGQCVNATGSAARFPSYGQCLQSGCGGGIRFPGGYQPGCLEWGCWDDPTWMSSSHSPTGPWTEPVIVLDPLPSGDTNLAGVINDDGSFVGLWRGPAPVWSRKAGGGGRPVNGKWTSAVRPVFARHWRDPSSYWVQPSVSLFPPNQGGRGQGTITEMGLEDPMVFKDRNGTYHALLTDGLFHAWSVDGIAWTLTPKMDYLGGLEGLPCEGKGGLAGRPHLVLGGDDGHTPIALTGSCYFDKPVPFGGSTYTALIPIDWA